MEAGKFNILIEKKATFRQDFFLYSQYDKIAGTGTAIDLTGATVSAKIKQRETDTSAILTFNANVISAADGQIRIELTPAQTASIGWTSGIYDILVTFPSGDVVKYIEGNVTISRTAS